MSVSEASALVPQFSLDKLIAASTNATVDSIIVTFPHYFANLSSIISETSSSTLQNFFVWKVVQSFAYSIDAEEITPLRQFNNELQGKEPDSKPERWRTCVSHVDGGLGWILSRFFVEKAFSAKAKDLGDQMVSDIKTEFIKKLKGTEWMEDKVVERAIEKVHNIVQKIGYPTEVSARLLSLAQTLTATESRHHESCIFARILQLSSHFQLIIQ
jgi:endothelin-converting enzyme